MFGSLSPLDTKMTCFSIGKIFCHTESDENGLVCFAIGLL